MITDNKIISFEDVISALKQRHDQPEGTKVGFDIEDQDPFAFYQSISLFPKAFCYSPKTQKASIYLGHINKGTKTTGILYGGIAFPTEQVTDQWESYGDQTWFSPIIHITWHQDTANLQAITGPDLDHLIQTITFTEAEDAEPKSPFAYEHTPNKREWETVVETAQKKIENGDIEKVVLARKTTLTFDRSISVFNLLRKTISAPVNHYIFHFHLNPDDAWVSLSPELLFYRKNKHVYSDALAGTRPRGETPEEDEVFKNQLLNSDKDIAEQRFVKDMILERLLSLCVTPPKEEPITVLQLKNVQHLLSRVSGILKEDVNDKAILDTLFPTPAVAGTPTAGAIEAISELESFDRGWYAGVLGVLSREESECIVGIRSVRVQKNSLTFYAGAGIVAQSNWENEWAEVESKLNIFMNRINDDQNINS